MPLLLSILMTSVVSLTSTVKSLGLSPHLTSRWFGAWGVSWLIAFPFCCCSCRWCAALVRTH